jgi:acetyl esterase/lipase
MPFAFRSQPLKALYVTYTTGSVIVRLPLWVFYYAIPGTRPRRSWTLSRTLINALYRVFIDYMWATQPMLMPTPAAVEAGGTAEADGLVWIDATPQLVTDDIARLARVNGVEAEKTAGYWFGPRGVDGKAGQKAGPNEKVVYYFHGGAFVVSV